MIISVLVTWMIVDCNLAVRVVLSFFVVRCKSIQKCPIFCSFADRPTLGPKLALTRRLRLCANFLISPYLALTRLNSPTLATAKWIPISMGVIHLTRLQTGPTGSGKWST